MAVGAHEIRYKECGSLLADTEPRPCPECGNTTRTVSVSITESVNAADRVSRESRREYYEKHPLALVTVAVITVGAPFLGLILLG